MTIAVDLFDDLKLSQMIARQSLSEVRITIFYPITTSVICPCINMMVVLKCFALL